MPVLDSCCCSSNLRTASIITGYYTLVLYTIILTTGSFHIHTVIGTPVMFPVTVTFVTLSALLVICSIILIIGLHGDSRGMLIPWLVMMATTTSYDVAVSAYLLSDSEFNPFVITLFVLDFFFCGLNIYCFLCVISQYQIYRKRSKKEKKVRLRRKRRERLRSGFPVEGEDGFDLPDGEEYEENDVDDYDDDDYDYSYGLRGRSLPEEDRMLRLDRQRVSSSASNTYSSSHAKKNSIYRLSRHEAAEGAELRKSYTGSYQRRSVSPIPSLPSSPSSGSGSSSGDVFSGEREGGTRLPQVVPVKSAKSSHTRVLLSPPSPSHGDFNRNNKSIVVTPHHYQRSSIKSKSGSEGDPTQSSSVSRVGSRPSSFSRISPAGHVHPQIRVPSKTPVNKTPS